MSKEILSRVAASANSLVERVFPGDTISVTLAAFEYGYQADMFAKVLSKDWSASGDVIIVRGHNHNYAQTVFQNGKEVKGWDHWARQIKWSDNAK